MLMEEKRIITFKEEDFHNGKPSFFKISEFMNDIAVSHAKNLGIGFQALLEKNLYWVLAKNRIDILKEIKPNEPITFVTWPLAGARLDCHREFGFYNSNNELVIKAIGKWLTIDIHSYRMIPVRNIQFPGEYKQESNYNLAEAFKQITISQEEKQIGSYDISEIDIDANKHTNNTRYLLMCEKYFNSDKNSVQIDFVNQSFVNDHIDIFEYNNIFEGKKNNKTIFKASFF